MFIGPDSFDTFKTFSNVFLILEYLPIDLRKFMYLNCNCSKESHKNKIKEN